MNFSLGILIGVVLGFCLFPLFVILLGWYEFKYCENKDIDYHCDITDHKDVSNMGIK